jgi:hypothetical protein
MKTRLIAITCALGIAACARQDAPPPSDPTSLDTTSAQTETTSLPAATPFVAKPSRTAAVAPTPATAAMPESSTTPTVPADAPAASHPGVADQTKNATNTKINERDRHGSLTPMDQGGSAAERNITAAIRRGVVGDKGLSFTAKNIKIITNGSKVTLRGPVKSDQERSAIEAHATQATGVTEVDNQIEVKK